MALRDKILLYGLVFGFLDAFIIFAALQDTRDEVGVVAILVFLFGGPLVITLRSLMKVLEDIKRDKTAFYFWSSFSTMLIVAMIISMFL